MFWLVHIHNENAFHGHSFGFSLDFRNKKTLENGHDFCITTWMGRSTQFIEKWKRAKAHVFFEFQGAIFYLANEKVSLRLGGPFKKVNLR